MCNVTPARGGGVKPIFLHKQKSCILPTAEKPWASCKTDREKTFDPDVVQKIQETAIKYSQQNTPGGGVLTKRLGRSGVEQMVSSSGSYPEGRRFESCPRNH